MNEAPLIELDDVGLTYPGPPAVRALTSCHAIVRHGEYVAVVGPSGSGKSTFLNVLGLLDVPTEGSYRLNGVDTRAMTERQRTELRASAFGFVFQAFHLLSHRTTLENVELGLLYRAVPRTERRERAQQVLADVGLSHRTLSLAGRLSGGERQRVAIARALVNQPQLLLCDEPTGNLDSRNAADVLSLIEGLHSDGQTIVVITHDMGVAGRAERRLSILDGCLTEPKVGW